MSTPPTALAQTTTHGVVLSGAWTAQGMGAAARSVEGLAPVAVASPSSLVADATKVDALDSAGAWVLQGLLQRRQHGGTPLTLHGLRPEFARLLELVAPAVARRQAQGSVLRPTERKGVAARTAMALERVGRWAGSLRVEAGAALSFVGECAAALAGCILHPGRMRWRSVLFNLRSTGFDALPIVGLLAFLLGIVVAYQSADQLRRYGANIFIADIIGLSMLREFAPLMTAIIVAGRSGSAFAAQIGTMQVTEEIDAMRTLGIAPQEMLVLPKLVALAIALPLLTVFADMTGVLGGMLMARSQLDVSLPEFLDRLVKAVSTTSYLTGIGKAPVFAAIIVLVGCYEGFRTRGGAESVGRQTTRSVVHSIFLVIVADALFSVAFNVLKL